MPAGRASEPAWRTLEPAGRVLELAGRVSEQGRRALEPAGRPLEPAERALKPARRPGATWEGQLRLQGGDGEKEREQSMWWYHRSSCPTGPLPKN